MSVTPTDNSDEILGELRRNDICKCAFPSAAPPWEDAKNYST